MTRWSNDPPLSAEHAIVQLDSRFPKAINLWASQGWSRITSRNSLTHGNKLASRRTVPVFGAACDFQVVPGPRPGIATWRSKHETEAQGYIKMWQKGMPPCRRSVKRTPPSFWPSTRPHGGQGCSHLHAAQVHDGTVIKFLLIPSNEGKIISVNEPQADAAARRCLCPVQRKKNCTPRRKKTAPHLG